jgi:hypothetical protein
VVASLAGGADDLLQNDAAYATLQIFDAPNVLVISAQADSAQVISFKNGLRNSGLQVDVIPPEDFSANLTGLDKYRVIFVHNLLAKSFSAEQIAALELFVAERGGGLVFLGGRYSYTLGGYKDAGAVAASEDGAAPQRALTNPVRTMMDTPSAWLSSSRS